MKRINPIFLLIALNVLLILFRDLILPEHVTSAIAEGVEETLIALGPFGYAGLVLGFGLCGFFFLPLMIPLNILGGALYGAWAGTAVALAGILLSTVTSTFAVRRVFTGSQAMVDRSPRFKRIIASADRHLNLVIVMVRFAVVAPLLQNIALAHTHATLTRLLVVTAVSAIPTAAIYSFLGAGLVEADRVTDLALYFALPVALMLGLSLSLAWFKVRLGDRAD